MPTSTHGLLGVATIASIIVGVAIFGIAAAFLSTLALVGIGLAAFGGITYTWLSHGWKTALKGLGTGFVGALVAWVAMRSMMRWVATSSGITPTFTIGGTLAILGSSLLLSVLPAMGYSLYRNRFKPTYRNSLLYGLVLLLLGGVPLVVFQLGEIGGIAHEPAIPISFLLGVPVLFSITLETTHRLFRWPHTLS